jgi:iron complex outermembrane receptor protein
MSRTNRFRFSASLTASVLALFAAPLAAEDAGQADEAEMDTTIVVTAARTELPASALPLTIDVLGGENLRDQVAVSGSVVDAVSARFPAFSPTREKLSGAGESLRGRSPLFAINGIPQSTPVRDGSRDGYTIDPFFIDRVEIIYGSNALQGIGATGGVVNQVTVGAPREDGVSGRALAQVTVPGGFEGEGFGGKIAAYAGYRAGKFDATVGTAFERRGAFTDGEGRRIGVDGTQGEIQDSDSWSVFGRVGYQVSDTARLDVVANRFDLEGNDNYVVLAGDRATGLTTSSVRGTTPGDTPRNRAELVSTSFVEEDLAGGILNLQGFFSRTLDVFGGLVTGTFQDPAIDPTGNLFDQSANRSRKLGGKASYERSLPGFEDLVVTVGFDALFDRTAQTLTQTGRTWVPQSDFRSLAPFAQGNLALAGGMVRLAGGARWENVRLSVPDYTTLAFYGSQQVAGGSPSFERMLWNGGAIFEPVTGVRAYGSYAEGYTIADVGRILRAVDEPGVDIDNFIALEPVISNNREVGLEVERGPLEASVSYYWSSSKLGSLLVLNSGGVFDVARQPIAIEGLELSLATRTPVPGLTLSTAYSQVIGRTDGDNDGQVDDDLDGANISPDRFNLAADYRAGPFAARLAARFYLSRTFNNLPARDDFAGYSLIDAFVKYDTGIGELSLAVNNLLDEQYITYNSDTVRTTDNLRFFAGRGRTFVLGWQVGF